MIVYVLSAYEALFLCIRAISPKIELIGLPSAPWFVVHLPGSVRIACRDKTIGVTGHIVRFALIFLDIRIEVTIVCAPGK